AEDGIRDRNVTGVQTCALPISDKKHIKVQLNDLRKKYQLTEYASHMWVKPVREHFGNRVNSAIAQKTASRAWLAFREKLFGKAEKVHFIPKGEMLVLKGKPITPAGYT